MRSSPWGCKESDTTERLNTAQHTGQVEIRVGAGSKNKVKNMHNEGMKVYDISWSLSSPVVKADCEDKESGENFQKTEWWKVILEGRPGTACKGSWSHGEEFGRLSP